MTKNLKIAWILGSAGFVLGKRTSRNEAAFLFVSWSHPMGSAKKNSATDTRFSLINYLSMEA